MITYQSEQIQQHMPRAAHQLSKPIEATQITFFRFLTMKMHYQVVGTLSLNEMIFEPDTTLYLYHDTHHLNAHVIALSVLLKP